MNQTATALIDGPAALRALREVVAEVGPEFQYHGPHFWAGTSHVPSDCRYVNLGKPDCIVAKTMHKLGVSVEELSRWEGTSARAMCPSQFRTTTIYGTTLMGVGDRPLLTEAAAQILQEAQGRQDANHPYGVALEAAETKARELGVTA